MPSTRTIASIRHADDNTLLRLYDEARHTSRTAEYLLDRERAGRLAHRIAAELRRRRLSP
jgi:hypothetical protein